MNDDDAAAAHAITTAAVWMDKLAEGKARNRCCVNTFVIPWDETRLGAGRRG